jgi:hypothetical protein
MLSTEQRRALGLLAGTRRGLTKGVLTARGFTIETLTGIVRDGLATARSETIRAGGHPIEVVRIMITDAGRKAITVD